MRNLKHAQSKNVVFLVSHQKVKPQKKRGIRKSVAGLWQKYTPFYGVLWGSMGV
jgi:hypothetical protein